MDDYYRELILDHARRPRNYGTLEQPTYSREEYNPLCGDRVRIDLLVEDDVITDIRFQGKGCAISQASASLLTEELRGKSLDQARALSKHDLLDLLGVPNMDKNPVRLKCALLPLKALKAGIYGVDTATDLDDE